MRSIEGLDGLMDYLDGLQDELLDAVALELDTHLRLTVDAAKMGAIDPEVRGSISKVVRRAGDDVEAEVIANHERAVYQEMGTGPEGAASDNGKAPIPVTYTLHSQIQSGRRAGTVIPGWIYKAKDGSFVHSMGQPARPFLYRASKETMQAVLRRTQEGVSRRLSRG